jgi:hypothetical protein
MTTLANIRFIADSMDYSFRGSNPQEQHDIERIRKGFAKYLYDHCPPKEVIEEFGFTATRLLAGFLEAEPWPQIIAMYENQKENPCQ